MMKKSIVKIIPVYNGGKNNVLEYCEKFDENSLQIEAFSRVYVRHIYTHLKQISSNNDLTKQEKYAIINKTCLSSIFKSANGNTTDPIAKITEHISSNNNSDMLL